MLLRDNLYEKDILYLTSKCCILIVTDKQKHTLKVKFVGGGTWMALIPRPRRVRSGNNTTVKV